MRNNVEIMLGKNLLDADKELFKIINTAVLIFEDGLNCIQL